MDALTIVLIITAVGLGVAFSLKASPASTLYCPMLISGSIWSSIAFLLSPKQLGSLKFVYYAVFLIAGVCAGIQTVKTFNFLRQRTTPPKAFWLILPIDVVIGVLFGLFAGYFVHEVLFHVFVVSIAGNGVLFGVTSGFTSSISSYVLWRIAVKWVWR